MTDPYGPLGSAFISKNGDIAVVTVQFDTQAQNLPKDVFDQIQQATAPATKAGINVAYGGAVTDYADQPPQGNADLIGLLAAVVILLFVFGSVVAMGLPILTALLRARDRHLARAHHRRRSPTSGRSRRSSPR